MSMQVEETGTTQPVAGIIYPPPDVRRTIDKAAAFLASKGPELANRIRETDRDNKFNFLNPNDPYHAYYQFKFTEVKEGRAPQRDNMNNDPVEETAPQPDVDMAPKEPEPFEFSATMPAMSAQDLDIMKLTAQFAARNGRTFIGQLAQRESRNYQFDFLRPSHSLFPYFTELVKQYTKVFSPPKDLQEKLLTNKNDKYHIMDRIKERVEWVVWQEAERKKKKDEDEKEKIAYASIDWHDFVVVETVEFTQVDEQADLPPPMSLSELKNMSLAQKRMASMPNLVQQDTKTTNDVEMDIDDVDMDESDEETPVQPAAPKVPDTNAPIKIKTGYKPKIIGVTPEKTTEATQICPRCGEAIPVSEMDEHMRIELLDSKWKEQKMASEAKNKDSNLLQEGTDIKKILKNFSGLRPDIFGSDEMEMNKKIKEKEEEAKKRDRVIWDGHTATIGLANQRANKTKLDDQIAMMHQRIGGTSEDIGPQIPGQPQPEMSHTAYAPPQYYNTMDQGQAFSNQVPGMYNAPNGGMPVTTAAPPPAAVLDPPAPTTPVIPAVRKAEDQSPSTPEKKPRTEPEQEWPVATPTMTLSVQTPNNPDKPEWHLTGASISVTGLLPNTLVSTVKDRIASQLGMPQGQQKLSTATTNTVLNNSKTLGFYGLMDGHSLVLEVRKR